MQVSKLDHKVNQIKHDLLLGSETRKLDHETRQPIRQNKGAYILNLTGGNPALASVGTNVTQRPMTGKTTLRRPHCN